MEQAEQTRQLNSPALLLRVQVPVVVLGKAIEGNVELNGDTLAIGYLLDEINNDITRETPASFEPTIDHVFTKIPRFALEPV